MGKGLGWGACYKIVLVVQEALELSQQLEGGLKIRRKRRICERKNTTNTTRHFSFRSMHIAGSCFCVLPAACVCVTGPLIC